MASDDDDDDRLTFQIWDKAGKAKFRINTISYYKGVNIIVYVFNVGDRQTFNRLPDFIRVEKLYGNKKVERLLIGNKIHIKIERLATMKLIGGQLTIIWYILISVVKIISMLY